MITHSKCDQDLKISHDPEDAGEKEYCVECYTELHYYLTVHQ